MRSGATSAALLVGALLVASSAAAPAQVVDSTLLSSLEARSLGPGGVGGEAWAVEAAPTRPDHLFVGAGGGTLWRSGDGGTNWAPILEAGGGRPVSGVAVSPADPAVIWAVTGTPSSARGRDEAWAAEASPASVRRTGDGGKSWQSSGPSSVARVGDVLAHGRDAEVAWVAGAGPDPGGRGVFRTGDGGRSWSRTLEAAPGVRAVDLARDPGDADRIYAALDASGGGGDGSTSGRVAGLYRSGDGGRSWERVGPEAGIPSAAGAVAIAPAPSDPAIVYAVVRDRGTTRLVRSADRGRTWRAPSTSPAEGGAAGLEADGVRGLVVDPVNPDRVYRLGRRLAVSGDGGATLLLRGGGPAGGIHGLWIDPDRPERMVTATGAGVYASRDRGRRWRFVHGLTLATVRAVDVDLATPFRIHAALEPTGAWRGPSTPWRKGGSRDPDWLRTVAGDATSVLLDAGRPRFTVVATGDGQVWRHDRRTDERKEVGPWPPRGAELRHGRQVPLASDPYRPEMIYLGTQFVHRTSDRGETWQIISSDLTGDGGGAASITALAASPVQEELVWAGTGNGRLHLTRSRGGTWTDLTGRLPGEGSGGRITWVEASKHHGGTAFVSLARRRSGDSGPHLYRTGDYGRSWRSMTGDGTLRGVVHVVEQDPVASEVLFAGTTHGLFVSVNGGSSWARWGEGVPPASVTSLRVHPRDYDLVVGTEGRGLFVVDDVRPLRALARSPERLRRPLHLFDPPPARLHHRAGVRGFAAPGHHLHRGQARPYGALLTYSVGPGGGEGSVRLEVVSEEDSVVHRRDVPASTGVHRVTWDLGLDVPGSGAEDGPRIPVLPGPYTVRLTSATGASSEVRLRVLPDPRSEVSMEARQAKQAALRRAARLLRVPAESVERLDDVEDAIAPLLDRLAGREGTGADTLRAAGRRLQDRAGELRRRAAAEVRGDGLLAGLAGSFDAPTETQRIALQALESSSGALADAVNDFLLGRVSLYNDRLREAGLDPLPDFEEVGR